MLIETLQHREMKINGDIETFQQTNLRETFVSQTAPMGVLHDMKPIVIQKGPLMRLKLNYPPKRSSYLIVTRHFTL